MFGVLHTVGVVPALSLGALAPYLEGPYTEFWDPRTMFGWSVH